MLSKPMTSAVRKPDGSSSAQNQKFRLNISDVTVIWSGSARAFRWSIRSRTPATQLMPPSDIQILMSGKRAGTCE